MTAEQQGTFLIDCSLKLSRNYTRLAIDNVSSTVLVVERKKRKISICALAYYGLGALLLTDSVIDKVVTSQRSFDFLSQFDTVELVLDVFFDPRLRQVQVLFRRPGKIIPEAEHRYGGFYLSAVDPVVVAVDGDDLSVVLERCSPRHIEVLSIRSVAFYVGNPMALHGVSRVLLPIVITGTDGWHKHQMVRIGKLLQLGPILPRAHVVCAVAREVRVESIESSSAHNRFVLFG